MEYVSLLYNAIVGLVALCGGLMFTWWWMVIGKASDVYHYTTAILYGIAIQCAVNLLILHMVFHGAGEQIQACDLAAKWWFTFRSAPVHIAMMCIVAAMTKRTITILRNSRKKKEPLPEETRMDVVSAVVVPPDPFEPVSVKVSHETDDGR